jgi:predicted nucleic acid-binding Zn ribbon protein
MADEKHFQSLPDFELDYSAYLASAPPKDVKLALKEIQRRQNDKQQQIDKEQRKIKNLTIAIFIIAVLTLLVGIIQLFK